MEAGDVKKRVFLETVLGKTIPAPSLTLLATEIIEIELPGGVPVVKNGDLPGGFFFVVSPSRDSISGQKYLPGSLLYVDECLSGKCIDVEQVFETKTVLYFVNQKTFDDIVMVDRLLFSTIFALHSDSTRRRFADLTETIRSQDAFFSIIAHDLKSPFGTVVGFADLLMHMDTHDSEKSSMFAGLILKSAQHAVTVLDNLLSWTRVKNGKVPVFLTEVNVVTILLEIYSELGLVIEKKGLEVLFDFSSEIIIADLSLATTIIKNVIDNAARYTSAGSIRITTFLENDYLCVCVKDTGCGMDKRALDTLFSVDVKKTGVDENGEPGTGLGMVIAMEYMILCHGKISVTSHPHRGTEVRLYFPTAK